MSVVCPAWVEYADHGFKPQPAPDRAGSAPNPEAESTADLIRQFVENGLSPEEVADLTFDAIENNRFYVVTHPDWLPLVERRMQDILAGRNPA